MNSAVQCTTLLSNCHAAAANKTVTAMYCTRLPERQSIRPQKRRWYSVPSVMLTSDTALASQPPARLPAHRAIVQNQHHAHKPEQQPAPLQRRHALAEPAVRQRRGQDRLQTRNQRREPGRYRMRDRDCGAAEIKSMHQQPCDDAVSNPGAIRPLRPCDRDDDSHQSHHHGHPDRQIGQRLGAAQRVFGGDKAGTPQHDKNRRRRARGKTLKITIHLPPLMPDHMLCGNDRSRRSARAIRHNEIAQETGRANAMDVRAAIATAAGKPLEITAVQLEGPREGEVLVEIKATGVCHTDEFTLSGADPEGLFPAILGHEGAGVVVDVGRGVTSVKKGDHVIPLYTPECRQCTSCLSRKPNLFPAIRPTQGQGLIPAGPSRFSTGAKPIHHYMGTSTFANYTVLPEIAVAKIRADAPFNKVCYIGCGVTTGIGAVINTAKVEQGAKAIVFGLGGIGLNVLQGLRLAGADMIIGVDINNDRKAWGERFGMTHFVNPKELGKDLVPHLIDMTKSGADQIGGAEYTFDCTGNVTVMRQALESCHRGWASRSSSGLRPLARK